MTYSMFYSCYNTSHNRNLPHGQNHGIKCNNKWLESITSFINPLMKIGFQKETNEQNISLASIIINRDFKTAFRYLFIDIFLEDLNYRMIKRSNKGLIN